MNFRLNRLLEFCSLCNQGSRHVVCSLSVHPRNIYRFTDPSWKPVTIPVNNISIYRCGQHVTVLHDEIIKNASCKLKYFWNSDFHIKNASCKLNRFYIELYSCSKSPSCNFEDFHNSDFCQNLIGVVIWLMFTTQIFCCKISVWKIKKRNVGTHVLYGNTFAFIGTTLSIKAWEISKEVLS